MKAKYETIAETLKAEIGSGKFAGKKSLPSEGCLAQRFSVSRGTVRQALSKLCLSGIIESHRGSGYHFKTTTARTGRIGLLMPEITFTPFFQRLAHEVSVAAEKSGCSVFLGQEAGGTAAKRAQVVKSVARRFVKQGVDGVIFRPLVDDCLQKANRTVIDILQKAKVPVVLLDCDVCHVPMQSGLDVVGINHLSAGRSIAAHLLECGCRRIVFLQGGPPSVNRRNRLAGVAGEVVSAGGQWGDDSVVTLTGSDAAGVEQVLRLLAGGATPDALICGHDAFAVMLMKRLAASGRRVPQDIAIVGFDDDPCAALATPPLTTIHQPARRIAAEAVKTLAWRIDHPDAPPRNILVPASLVVRGSTVLQAHDFTLEKERSK